MLIFFSLIANLYCLFFFLHNMTMYQTVVRLLGPCLVAPSMRKYFQLNTTQLGHVFVI